MFNLSLRTDKISYLVVHDTGNSKAGATAKNNVIFFSGGDRDSSADEFIDDKGVAVFNTNMRKYYSWHCGDGGSKYGIGNSNSIGVEICTNSDGNYTQAVTNAVAEVKRLMAIYGIDLAHVVRHYDASRKMCPNSMSANNWAKWNEFKARLGGANVATSTVLKNGSNSPAVKTLQTNLNLLGYNCGTPDGDFGAGTEKAVRAFQTAKKLTVDGEVGAGTLSAIAKAIVVKNTPVVKPVVKPVIKPVVKPVAQMYRVRKTWADVKGQIGAYADLQSAKDLANRNIAYTVFDVAGKAVYKYSAPAVKTVEQRVAELEARVDKLD